MEKVKGFKGILILLEIIDVLANSKNYSLLASPAYTNVLKS